MTVDRPRWVPRTDNSTFFLQLFSGRSEASVQTLDFVDPETVWFSSSHNETNLLSLILWHFDCCRPPPPFFDKLGKLHVGIWWTWQKNFDRRLIHLQEKFTFPSAQQEWDTAQGPWRTQRKNNQINKGKIVSAWWFICNMYKFSTIGDKRLRGNSIFHSLAIK